MSRRVSLRDVASQIDYGLTTSATDAKDGPKFLRITDIDKSFIEWGNVPHCVATPEQREKYALQSGDIVVARTGASTGRSQWVQVEADTVFASYLVRFRIFPDYDSRFIGYVLNSRAWKHYVDSVAHGKSAQPNMSASIMADFEFDCPPLSKQRAIAEVLGALDDKIAANNEAEATSRSLAQARFDALLRGKTSIAPLRSVLQLEYGKSLPASKRVSGDINVFGSGGIVGSHNESLRTGPGVIVGRKGSVGSVHWSETDFFPIDTTYYVIPKTSDISLLFCYHLLSSLPLADMNSDSAVPGLNREEALSLPVRIPEPEPLIRFSEETSQMFSFINQLSQENLFLISTRDALLPQLMSGKIRVREAEAVVEDVL